jgi:uncharacterized protein YgiM (DUF1202 family)
MTSKRLLILCVLTLFTLVACDSPAEEPVAQIPTATLVPLITLSPIPTATPVLTNTPIPTFTLTPTETYTPSPSAVPPTLTPTPPITAYVGGAQRINFRVAPSETAEIIGALTPGDPLRVLHESIDGSWLNVRTGDGLEGWVASRLIHIPPTNTPFPTSTPTVDLTAVALGTTLPTAVIGGLPVTPTPPAVALSPTATEQTPELGATSAIESLFTVEAPTSTATAEATQSFLPVIDMPSINMTSTAIARSSIRPEMSSAPSLTLRTAPSTNNSPNITQAEDAIIAPPLVADVAEAQNNVFVFAMCDNPEWGDYSVPTNLGVGTSVTVWWGWIASDPLYFTQHEDAVDYQVTINGELLPDWRNYGTDIQVIGNTYVKHWYIPAGFLDIPGIYEIEIRASWSRAITDGYERFGPTTENVTQVGSCTFAIQ